jgi:hypothetical protein
MPTLVPLPESNISPAGESLLPQTKYSEPTFHTFEVDQCILTWYIGKGCDMTPLDVNLPAAVTLKELLYSEKNISGDNGSHGVSATLTLIREMVIILIAVTMMLMMMLASLVP